MSDSEVPHTDRSIFPSADRSDEETSLEPEPLPHHAIQYDNCLFPYLFGKVYLRETAGTDSGPQSTTAASLLSRSSDIVVPSTVNLSDLSITTDPRTPPLQSEGYDIEKEKYYQDWSQYPEGREGSLIHTGSSVGSEGEVDEPSDRDISTSESPYPKKPRGGRVRRKLERGPRVRTMKTPRGDLTSRAAPRAHKAEDMSADAKTMKSLPSSNKASKRKRSTYSQNTRDSKATKSHNHPDKTSTDIASELPIETQRGKTEQRYRLSIKAVKGQEPSLSWIKILTVPVEDYLEEANDMFTNGPERSKGEKERWSKVLDRTNKLLLQLARLKSKGRGNQFTNDDLGKGMRQKVDTILRGLGGLIFHCFCDGWKSLKVSLSHSESKLEG